MAKNKTKENLKRKIYSLLYFILIVVITISANSYKKFSDYLPTWNSLYTDVMALIDDDFNVPRILEKNCYVHYIDVKQGSSILIMSNDMNVLIDGGEVSQGDKVLEYLKQHDVKKLDYVVATHPHSDHIGGLIKVMQNIETKNVIMPSLPKSLIPTTKVFEEFLNVIEQNKITVINSNVGDKYQLGKGHMYVLAPSFVYDNLNDMSIAIKFTYGDVSFLSTGDMEKNAEKDLLKTGYNLKADVFALSHHGSKYGNIDELLSKVNAKYYVAQCGLNNEYGHPHNEVLQRADKYGATVLRSDKNGDIVFISNGSDLYVQTQKE